MTNETQEQTELLEELATELSQTQIELYVTATTLKHNESQNIIKNHVIASTTMGLIPIALIDIAALSANQHTMLQHLCKHYEVDYDSQRSKLLISALLSGSLPVLTMMGLSSAVKVIPGIGTLGGNAGVAITGGAITYATGQTFVRHFSAGGNLDDFIPARFSGFFNKELKKGKQFVNKMKPGAVAEAIAEKGK